MKTAIVYFSGTGNSYNVALSLSSKIESDLYYLPNTHINKLEAYDRIILISSMYSFGVPLFVEEYIKKMAILDTRQHYIVLTYAGFSANAKEHLQNLYLSYGIDIYNIFEIRMPLNFTIAFTMPEFMVNMILKQSTSKIDKIASAILMSKKRKFKANIFKNLDIVHNNNDAKLKLMAKNYIVLDTCTGCQLCKNICPTKNIEIYDNKPVFNDHCCACLACFQRCPVKAINYGEKTIGKKRYINPNVDLNNMK